MNTLDTMLLLGKICDWFVWDSRNPVRHRRYLRMIDRRKKFPRYMQHPDRNAKVCAFVDLQQPHWNEKYLSEMSLRDLLFLSDVLRDELLNDLLKNW